MSSSQTDQQSAAAAHASPFPVCLLSTVWKPAPNRAGNRAFKGSRRTPRGQRGPAGEDGARPAARHGSALGWTAPRTLFLPLPGKCRPRDGSSLHPGLVSRRRQNGPGGGGSSAGRCCRQTGTCKKVWFQKVLTKEETMVNAEPHGHCRVGRPRARSSQASVGGDRRPGHRFAGRRRAAPHPLGGCFPVRGSVSGASVWTAGTPRGDVPPAPACTKPISGNAGA